MNYQTKENVGCITSIIGAGIGACLVCTVFMPDAPGSVKTVFAIVAGMFGFAIGKGLVDVLIADSFDSPEKGKGASSSNGRQESGRGEETKQQQDEHRIRREREERERQERVRREREDHFISCIFAMAAKLAKADGHVDESEVRVSERLFAKFNITASRRQKFRDIFNNALLNPHQIYPYADFVAQNATDQSVCVFLYELLWDIACADGFLDPAEKEILRNICVNLKVPNSYFDINYRRRAGTFREGKRQKRAERQQEKGQYHEDNDGFRNDGSQQTRNTHRSSCGLDWAYDLLGCSSDASNGEVKAAYRKAAKAYHPDLLRANGVPEDLIAVANEKMIKLNEAWERIRKERGI